MKYFLPGLTTSGSCDLKATRALTSVSVELSIFGARSVHDMLWNSYGNKRSKFCEHFPIRESNPVSKSSTTTLRKDFSFLLSTSMCNVVTLSENTEGGSACNATARPWSLMDVQPLTATRSKTSAAILYSDRMKYY